MDSYRAYRKWVVRCCLLILCLLGGLGLFNYLADPLWCYSHGFHITKYRKPFNERQQKTNFLTFCNSTRYDALILGNSRTSLVNQHEFSGMRAYNYSMAGMTPYEYGEYIDYFKRTTGTPATVILGLDFGNTITGARHNAEKPPHYIAMANSPFYRFRTLLTSDTFRYSWDNVRIPHFIAHKKRWTGHLIYDQANVVSIIPPNDEATRQRNMSIALEDLAASYGSAYRYREDLKGLLQKLREENRSSRFLVFTTPVTERYYCVLVRAGRMPEYERWLREMVDVFGQVWHFEYPHSIARDPASFCDNHHFYPPVGTLLAHRMTGVADPGLPEDFGMLLTTATIDEGLARIRAASRDCRPETLQAKEAGLHEK